MSDDRFPVQTPFGGSAVLGADDANDDAQEGGLREHNLLQHLVVIGHPAQDSFNHAIAKLYCGL